MTHANRICLTMIVKNETAVLPRLFNSLKNIISYYVIVDTGSTDGTPAFIKQWMGNVGIKGEVHSHDWVNFGYNRNQALQYAYQSEAADWALFIDADEELAFTDPLFYQRLIPGVSYSLEKRHHQLRYLLPNLVDISQTRWEWQGVVHEYLSYIDGSMARDVMPEAWIIYHEGEGVRSRGVTAQQKFLSDARLLETELTKNPTDTRSRFYLAQSYRDAGIIDKAYKNYLKRARMEGWPEENFVAQYQAGVLAIRLNKPYPEVLELLLNAYEKRPSRGTEPLHQLAAYCRQKNGYAQAYMFAKTGSEIPYPADMLFVEKDTYEWRILDELSIAAYWTGRYLESKNLCEKLLSMNLSETDTTRIKMNLDFAIQKLSE